MNNTSLMKKELETDRLILKSLNLKDFKFIKTLVNTSGWIKFIGDRNIKTFENAKKYIQKITNNKDIQYWVVSLKEINNPIGIITFIKRDYLEFFDLGFAFLPDFEKNGYAFEASKAILLEIKLNSNHQNVLATTVPSNHKSIALLEKLGFIYMKEIINNDEVLLIYLKVIL